jgi:hypothetical protein
MRNQRGLTMSGFMTWAVIFIVVILIAFKLGPAYWEEVTIKKIFKAMAADPGLSSGNRRAVEGAFQLRNAVENVSSISPKDIEISKDGTNIVFSATYTARVPLFHNVSACMDFSPSSR